ncbi:MAG: ATP phosphoribosyltransferase regulatory subunit [Oscillospiraceae bacterium]|nr:ATP phosphoribosyltransferase regulatory subunit [Oscillospiraceae bacterium]
MNKTIGTPEGTKDRLFSECGAFRRVEQSVLKVFRCQGYCEMTTPNVEYYDLISAAGHPMAQESMLKIIDRTGKILVMRPDCTVAMGRVAATKLTGLPLPLRLYYNQMVYRSDDVNTGARSEIDQCGVELIGSSGIRADLEVISLAIASLDACGLRDYHIEIGHAGYFDALLDALHLNDSFREQLKELVEAKAFTAFASCLKPFAGEPAAEALLQLPRLFGGPEVLETALCPNESAAEVLAYLKNLYQVLKDAGLSSRVQFDLGLIHTIEYYTGMVFRGYSEGAASNVLSGGRYDKLIGKFGQDVPATGFALDVEAVASCLPQPEHLPPETVVWYDLQSLGPAMEIVKTYPEGTAMLSCAESAEDAQKEAIGLGASRLVLVCNGEKREVSL